jgi:hypothetical protein
LGALLKSATYTPDAVRRYAPLLTSAGPLWPNFAAAAISAAVLLYVCAMMFAPWVVLFRCSHYTDISAYIKRIDR